MLAVTSVPPPTGLSTPQPAVVRGEPVARGPRRPARRPGAAHAVVAHLDASGRRSTRAVTEDARAGVLGDVGQRLRDDEVGRRLDGGGAAADGTSTRPAAAARGERLDARAQPAAREHRGQDAVRELAQLGHRLLRLVERLVHEGGGVLVASLSSACARQLQGDDGVTSRCCAPSWRSRTTRRRSSSAAATIRARDAARSARAWTFEIAVATAR